MNCKICNFTALLQRKNEADHKYHPDDSARAIQNE